MYIYIYVPKVLEDDLVLLCYAEALMAALYATKFGTTRITCADSRMKFDKTSHFKIFFGFYAKIVGFNTK